MDLREGVHVGAYLDLGLRKTRLFVRTIGTVQALQNSSEAHLSPRTVFAWSSSSEPEPFFFGLWPVSQVIHSMTSPKAYHAKNEYGREKVLAIAINQRGDDSKQR